ncbi:helix-turn-helix domain-containing protein [Candidatus Allofournierella excrementavium]|uniref:helix-turn-helix domain-containing protein n=1 Tax=Candidatus Allofournierella excrementavium TaxID=2838591 RepID=UPI003AB5DBAC
MPIRYKIDVLAALKAAGYSSTRLRKEKLMGQATMTQLRRGELVSWLNIGTICRLLNCQPGDIMEYVDESEAGQ